MIIEQEEYQLSTGHLANFSLLWKVQLHLLLAPTLFQVYILHNREIRYKLVVVDKFFEE